jgi:hypothetical protein
LGDFQNLLDRHGSTMSVWPLRARRSAERLLAISPEARSVLARAAKLDALIRADSTPLPPTLDSILDRAWTYPQATSSSAPTPLFGRPELGRWYVAAFASCLVCGLLLGVFSTIERQPPDWLYAMIDGSHVGEFHE